MRLFLNHYFECLFSMKRLRFIYINRGYWNAAFVTISIVLFFSMLFFIPKPDGAIQYALSSLAITIPLLLSGVLIPLEPKGQRSVAGIIAIFVNLVGIAIMGRGINSLIDHFNDSYRAAFENTIFIAAGIYAASCLLDAWGLTMRDSRKKKIIQRPSESVSQLSQKDA